MKIRLRKLLDASSNITYEENLNKKKLNQSFLTKLTLRRRKKRTDNTDFIGISIFPLILLLIYHFAVN